MKKIFLAILLFSIFINAQNQRFIYDYKYFPDSLNKEKVINEMMVLDITSKGSMYYSYQKFQSDSAMNADMEKQLQAQAGSNNINIKKNDNYKGTVSYKVTKEYPNYAVFLHERIGQDRYRISEDQKPVWKIFPDKQKIGNYNAQKATTNFGGRSWIAWFSSDLPFPDGPYKFYGLPGLIVKLEDTTHSHEMVLVANKKLVETEAKEKETNLPPGVTLIGMNGKEINATEKQFNKVWKDYLKDPSKNMREMMMRNSSTEKVVIKMKTPDGREISDMNEIYRSMEKRVKESQKTNNNKIEPDLYK